MKLRAVLLFLFPILIGAVGAGEPAEKAWLQPLRAKLEQKISIELDETPIDEGLTALRGLTTVPIVIDPAAYVEPGPQININLKDASLSQALKKMLEPADLDYGLVNEAVFVFKRNAYALAPLAPSGSLPEDKAREVRSAIADLGSDDFAVRQKANAALLGFGAAAAPYLDEAAKKCSDPEVLVRLQNLLAPYKGKPLPEPKADVAKFLDGLTATVSFEFEDTKLEDAIKELFTVDGKPSELKNPVGDIAKELQSRSVRIKAVNMQLGNALRWLSFLTGSTLVLDGEKIKFTTKS
jgi:hypothetical protein